MEVQMRLYENDIQTTLVEDAARRKDEIDLENGGGNDVGRQIFLGILGMSAGVVVAGGLFSFIVELGVISDFADRTHTANHILLYEDAVSAGAILGNVFQIFRIGIPGQSVLLAFFGLFAGIFVGCWSMALAEILNVFPIFMRRARIVRYAAVFILMLALGKGIGAGLFFWKGW